MSGATGDDLSELRAALAADVGAIAENLVGSPPTSKTRRELRFYPSQRLAVVINGPKRGVWHVHDSSEGGGPFELIRYLLGCSFAAAVEWARKWTGIGRQGRAQRPAPQPAPIAVDTEDAERLANIEAARYLYSRSQPVAGTLGEHYLVDVRGIPAPETEWPDAGRWHPGTRSMLFAATLPDGTVQAVQRVELDANGQNARDERGRKLKWSRGPQDGAIVRFPAMPGKASGPLLLAEGPETGLSVWRATGHEVWVTLGSMVKAALPIGRKIVVCADDDPPAHDFKQGGAARRLKQALGQWQRAGHDVVKATPWAQQRGDKTDFNDLIRKKGLDAVRGRIEWALSPEFVAPLRVSVEQARDTRDQVTERFFAVQSTWQPPAKDDTAPIPPPVHLVNLDTGTGKSDAARRQGARVLSRMRAADDDRNLAIAVPTLHLGDEQAARFNALLEAKAANLTARVWRGREAPDPTTPGKAMCHDLEAVKLVQEANGNVQAQACGTGKLGDPECPFFWQCGYQRQKRREMPDAWIVAHEMLFTRKPKELGKLAAVVVDESFWEAGLRTHSTFPLDLLDAPLKAFGLFSVMNRLKYLRHQLLDLLRNLPDGPVPRATLVEASFSFTSSNTGEAYSIERMREIAPNMHPGMSKKDRREAAADAAVNRDVERMASIWNALKALVAADGPKRSGWVELTRSDDGTRMLSICGRRNARKGWQVPTLILDATLNPALVTPYYPQAEMVAEIRVQTPHMRVRQVDDKAYAKAMLAPATPEQEKANPENASYKRRNLKKLRAILFREARAYTPGKVLVVVQKAVEEGLRELGPLPPNVDLAHHNAVAGRDEWRDVRAVIVVGRTQPSPGAVEKLAEQLTGRAVVAQESYTRTTTVREMASGKVAAADADRHDDPTAEAIRWQIAEGEVVQIIGRGRAVNRSSATPLDVLVMCDVPLPLPVDELVSAKDLEPSQADRMLAEGGVVLLSPRDAKAAYDDLWLTWEAAKKALDRDRKGTNHNNDILFKLCPPPVRVGYQVAGEGRRRVEALVDPAMVPDPRAWLEGKLGPLAWFEMTQPVFEKEVDMPELLSVPVQVEHVPNPQPGIEKELVMEQAEAPMPDLTPAQADCLQELFRRMAAPWPTRECDYWSLDTSELTKWERWELMPLPPPICQAMPAMVT